MLELKEIRRQLEDSSLCKVAKKSGLTYPTLRRLMAGDERLTLVTVKKISEYLYKLRLDDDDREVTGERE